jgi:uncharacterized membrane protein YdfJ with MMPL/SSD domain
MEDATQLLIVEIVLDAFQRGMDRKVAVGMYVMAAMHVVVLKSYTIGSMSLKR